MVNTKIYVTVDGRWIYRNRSTAKDVCHMGYRGNVLHRSTEEATRAQSCRMLQTHGLFAAVCLPIYGTEGTEPVPMSSGKSY